MGASNVVDDGKTHTFASNTKAVGQQSVASLVYATSSIVITLTPGVTYLSSGHIATYTGSSLSSLTEATSNVIGTTTVPLQASALLGQFVEASASATPEQILVEALPLAEEYALNGKTATAAAPSDVPFGALILAGLGAVPGNASRALTSPVLPSVVLVNGTVSSISSSQVGSSPGSTSAPGSKALSSSGTGPRVIRWLWVSGTHFVVFGYILGIALIM